MISERRISMDSMVYKVVKRRSIAGIELVYYELSHLPLR